MDYKAKLLISPDKTKKSAVSKLLTVYTLACLNNKRLSPCVALQEMPLMGLYFSVDYKIRKQNDMSKIIGKCIPAAIALKYSSRLNCAEHVEFCFLHESLS